MKKIIRLLLGLSILTPTTNLKEEVLPNFNSNLSSIRTIKKFSNVEVDNFAFSYSSRNENQISVHYLYDASNTYEGYYLLYSENIITALYHGSYIPESVDDLPDLLTETSDVQKQTEIAVDSIVPTSTTVDRSNLLCYPSYLFKSEIYSQSASRYISQCPEYFNDIYGFENKACSAVAGAMLISFYDRYSNYDLVDGLLPLQQDDNVLEVHKLVSELMIDRHTSTKNGTTFANELTGLRAYLDKHNGSSIQIQTQTSFFAYQYWILNSCNPVLASFAWTDDSGFTHNHAVLGTGFATIRNGSTTENYYRVHYDSSDHSRTGEYILNNNVYEMNYFRCLTKK